MIVFEVKIHYADKPIATVEMTHVVTATDGFAFSPIIEHSHHHKFADIQRDVAGGDWHGDRRDFDERRRFDGVGDDFCARADRSAWRGELADGDQCAVGDKYVRAGRYRDADGNAHTHSDHYRDGHAHQSTHDDEFSGCAVDASPYPHASPAMPDMLTAADAAPVALANARMRRSL